jgi:hypothetical protein
MKDNRLFSNFASGTKINNTALNIKIKIFVNYFFGPVIFFLLIGGLYRQISNSPDFFKKWGQISSEWNSWRFWLSIVLVFVNWGIESIKWRLLVNQVQQFSFARAVKSVLSGCAVTLLTPNRVGEFGGRILYVKAEHRLKAISLSLVGSVSQLLVTMLMGSLGLLFIKYFFSYNNRLLAFLPDLLGDAILYLTVGSTLLLLLFYLRLRWLVIILDRFASFKKVVNHIRVLDEFSFKQLLQILFLSLVRYIVFVLQYVLLMHVMQVEVAGWLCFCLLTVFYMVMTIIPSLGFVELPVRVTTAWVIFKMYTSNELGIGVASMGIWLINVVLPAVVGSLLLLNIKIIKEK